MTIKTFPFPSVTSAVFASCERYRHSALALYRLRGVVRASRSFNSTCNQYIRQWLVISYFGRFDVRGDEMVIRRCFNLHARI